MPMIEFQNVSKHYPGSAPALTDLSFAVEKGELVFLAGASGAGKSTLLKLIAAIERPSAGSIHVNGQDIGRLKSAALPYLRRNLGLIFQQQRLLCDRSALANVALPLIVTGTSPAEAQKRARAALDKVGLLDKSAALPQTLSGGEQQRIAIARAIVHRPQLILADEPTANLDRKNAERVLETILAFYRVGVTCLISTHDEAFLDRADRVIYLEQGKSVPWHDFGAPLQPLPEPA